MKLLDLEGLQYFYGKLQTEIDGDLSTIKNYTINGHKLSESPITIDKSSVGLSNVTNDAQLKRSELGQANGVAQLDSAGKVPTAQLPSFEYTLPVASSSTLGGIKVGTGLEITGDGVLNCTVSPSGGGTVAWDDITGKPEFNYLSLTEGGTVTANNVTFAPSGYSSSVVMQDGSIVVRDNSSNSTYYTATGVLDMSGNNNEFWNTNGGKTKLANVIGSVTFQGYSGSHSFMTDINIKSVNGQTLYGTGDITISAPEVNTTLNLYAGDTQVPSTASSPSGYAGKAFVQINDDAENGVYITTDNTEGLSVAAYSGYGDKQAKAIVINAQNATASFDGLMASEDYTKLQNVNNQVSQYVIPTITGVQLLSSDKKGSMSCVNMTTISQGSLDMYLFTDDVVLGNKPRYFLGFGTLTGSAIQPGGIHSLSTCSYQSCFAANGETPASSDQIASMCTAYPKLVNMFPAGSLFKINNNVFRSFGDGLFALL